MFNKVILPFIFFFFATPVFSVSVTVTDKPSTISTDPFSVTVSVYGANPGTNYLRVDLFKEETSNYFGETYNGTEWYMGSVGTSYFPIDIVSAESTASATFQAKIGAPTKTEYPGPGVYKLRIRRYTSASSSSPSDAYDATIDVPLPTSTPAPTAAATLTKTPTKTPTSSPAFTNTPTKTPTATLKKVTESPMPEITDEVLGETTTVATVAGTKKSTQPVIVALLLVGSGLGLLSGVFIWQKRNAMKP